MLLFAASAGAGELELGSLFQDHVVLQREKEINVWGWTSKRTSKRGRS